MDLAIYQTYFNSGIYAKTQQQGKSEEVETAIASLTKLIQEKEKDIEPALKSECYLKLGQWHYEHKVHLNEEDFRVIMTNCERATSIDSKNHDAWHFYSLMNYEASIFYSKRLNEEFQQHEGASSAAATHSIFDEFSPQTAFQIQQLSAHATARQKLLGQKYVYHVVNAIKGLVQQLSLSDLQMFTSDTTKTLQNTLRLLKLWFRHGNIFEIEQIVRNGFDKIDLKVWIDVIPQLLAR